MRTSICVLRSCLDSKLKCFKHFEQLRVDAKFVPYEHWPNLASELNRNSILFNLFAQSFWQHMFCELMSADSDESLLCAPSDSGCLLDDWLVNFSPRVVLLLRYGLREVDVKCISCIAHAESFSVNSRQFCGGTYSWLIICIDQSSDKSTKFKRSRFLFRKFTYF